MAGIIDGLVKGLATLAPQDNPDVKIFNAQTEIKEIAEKETLLFAELGRKIYAEGGATAYTDITTQLDALATNKAAAQQTIQDIEAQKAAVQEAPIQSEPEGNICPECRTANPAGTKFCHQCGTKLITEKSFCNACGAELKPGIRFCGVCGAKQGE